ncbi:MAG: hypothetical protein Ct9H300mP14_06860 [Gammaproteobacteria bacterium]|nr:MAG: hypothetical protein Ct9H300mP14_06860 [Gammaproteobacteria bacterium]
MGDHHVGLQARLMSQALASYSQYSAIQYDGCIYQPDLHEDWCKVWKS